MNNLVLSGRNVVVFGMPRAGSNHVQWSASPFCEIPAAIHFRTTGGVGV